jgi:hypothetical protein
MKIIFRLKDGEQIQLRSDSMNYELCRISRNTDPESGELVESFVPYKYFQALSQALSKILELKVRASDATDLKQLASDLEAARGELVSVWSTQIKGVKR